MRVAKGILTGGLGGDATSMLLGGWRLGQLKVEVFFSGDHPRYIPHSVPKEKKQQFITIVVTRNGERWARQYMIGAKRSKAVIKVTKIINSISTRILVTVDSITSIAKKIGVLLWKK